MYLPQHTHALPLPLFQPIQISARREPLASWVWVSWLSSWARFPQVWVSVVKSICSAALWTLWGSLPTLLQLLKYLPYRAAAQAWYCGVQPPKQSSDSLHERDGSLKQPGLAALSQLNSRWRKKADTPGKKGELIVLCTETGRINSLSLRLPHGRKMCCQGLCMENEVTKLILMEFSHHTWMCARVNTLVAQKERWQWNFFKS